MKDWMILFMVFVVLFIALIPTTAFAEENDRVYDKTGNDAPINVYGKYVENTDRPVYSINISWGNMEFTYTEGSKGTWNPATHSYDNPISAGWTCSEGGNLIKVVNHSNTAINIKLSFDSDTDLNFAISGTFDNSDFTLKTAEGTDVNKAPSKESLFTLIGSPSENFNSESSENKSQLGTISIKIN